MKDTIHVLVVDDSAFMRKSLSLMLESDPQIKVIGTARDGQECIDKIRELKPDLVTLDIEMPRMDGITALKIIMKEMPVPVLVVSSLSTEGAKVTIDALSLGAVDFIPKDLSYGSLDITNIKDEINEKVKKIASGHAFKNKQQERHLISPPVESAPKKSVNSEKVRTEVIRKDFGAVVIGISTGGPNALFEVVPKLPANLPIGIAIVQHMPPHFTKTLAERLDHVSELKVKEVENREPIDAGTVFIAPGGYHLTFLRNKEKIYSKLSTEPKNVLYRPSVDIMMSSAAEIYPNPLIGLIMTGMGKDGLNGLQLIKQKKGYVIAQHESTCVVYGMPKVAVENKLADSILPLNDIPNVLLRLIQ